MSIVKGKRGKENKKNKQMKSGELPLKRKRKETESKGWQGTEPLAQTRWCWVVMCPELPGRLATVKERCQHLLPPSPTPNTHPSSFSSFSFLIPLYSPHIFFPPRFIFFICSLFPLPPLHLNSLLPLILPSSSFSLSPPPLSPLFFS